MFLSLLASLANPLEGWALTHVVLLCIALFALSVAIWRHIRNHHR